MNKWKLPMAEVFPILNALPNLLAPKNNSSWKNITIIDYPYVLRNEAVQFFIQ